MKKEWHYLNNQFEHETKNNFKLAYKLSVAHNGLLFERKNEFPTDLDYPILYNRYNPLHLVLEAKYYDYKSRGGVQKGKTLTVNQQLKLLPERINKYDVMIQAVYEKGSDRYVELFPNKHKPFYKGTKDNRIAAVGSLNNTIGTDAALADVKLLVNGTLNDLVDARHVQLGAKGSKETGSGALENARKAAMLMQYQDLAFLINKFPDKPDMVRTLFDVESLTNPEQTIWKGHLDPSENHPTLTHTFEAGDIIRIKSTGKSDIMAYLASTPGGTDSEGVAINSGQQLKFDVIQFKVTDYSKNRFLTLVNVSDSKETRFIVELY